MANKSDVETYDESKKLLKDRIRDLYKDKEGTFVVSISRKGPKLLEYLFRDESDVWENSNTLTEYGLPFLFHRLGREKGVGLRICLVDDAIYYGTTMDRLTREVAAFSKLFGIRPEILRYAAIRDKDSSPLLKDVIALDGLRSGYGHYFIKRLTSDIRSLKSTFEVEFPSVRFAFNKEFDIPVLLRTFSEVFGEDNVYHIHHEESDSINILLQNVNGSLFNKFRVYVDQEQHVLNVACLAPRVIDDKGSDIENIFHDTPLESLWQDVLEASKLPEDISELELTGGFIDNERIVLERNRSLVVLANYLLSFSSLVQQKELLGRVFSLLDENYRYVGVKMQHVYYLTADRMLSKSICDKLEELYQSGIPYVSGFTKKMANQESMAFSSPDSMVEEDLAVLDNQNRLMLKNSKNLQEALSALSFNQTILVEKRMRRIGFYDFHRLHFGYTFDALMSDVQKYVPFSLDDNAIMYLHKWVDQRIDKGCLVPQYIETGNGFWLRVFRPGENEDEILSHLARYALFIFKQGDAVLHLGWLPDDVFRDLLSISYRFFSADLSQALGIPMQLEKNRLCFRGDEQNEYQDLMEYLVNMHIFTFSNDKIRISPRLVDEELMQNTTLDSHVEEAIGKKLKKVLEDLNNSGVPLDQSFLVLNYYLYDWEDRTDAADAMRRAVESSQRAIAGWKEFSPADDEDIDSYWEETHENYIGLADYVVYNKIWLSPERLQDISLNPDVQRSIYSEQNRMNSLILEMEILLSTFLVNDESLTRDILKEITDTSENPVHCVSENVVECTKALLEDYSSDQRRDKVMQAITCDLPTFLNDK